MATLSFPATPNFRTSTFGLRALSEVFTSPLNRVTQTVGRPGAVWAGTYVLPRMNQAAAAAWRAFLVSLDGRNGRFYGYDPDLRSPQGAYNDSLDTPQVMGANQVGTTLVIDGLRTGVTDIFLTGDYFDLVVDGVRRLHTVVADASSDGSGIVTLSIRPALRGSPADGVGVTFVDPVCEMMLTSDDAAVWSSDQAKVWQSLSFSGVEALG